MSKFKLNYGYALLEPTELEQTYGNIVIPDIGQEKPRMGEIISLEPIYNFHKGETVPSKFSVGDTVLYPAMGGSKIKIDNKEYIVIGVQEIFTAIIKE